MTVFFEIWFLERWLRPEGRRGSGHGSQNALRLSRACAVPPVLFGATGDMIVNLYQGFKGWSSDEQKVTE